MAGTVLVDAGFLAALFRHDDGHRRWAVSQASQFRRPWHTCEAVLSETFFLIGARGGPMLDTFLRRRAVLISFELGRDLSPVLALMKKYSNVPMSLADACLVRMTEIFADSVVLTTDTDFRIYRRHSRQVVPCVMPF